MDFEKMKKSREHWYKRATESLELLEEVLEWWDAEHPEETEEPTCIVSVREYVENSK